MRKSIVITLILLFLVTCMVCIAKFEDKNYIIDTQESKDILKTDEKFDCDAKECIDILNVDIKKENLRTIPNHCIQEKISESIEHDNEQKEYDYTIYRYNISETLKLELYSLDDLNGKISALKIVCKGSPEIVETDELEAEKYFKVICNHVCPKFDVNQFLKSNRRNNIQVDNITFYSRLFNTENEGGELHKEKIYCVSVMYNNDIL